jgi:phage portal protein BeeE
VCDVCRATDDEVDAYGDSISRGDLYYEIFNSGSGDLGGSAHTTLAAKNMFHVRGFGEGPVGVNVIAYASQSLGWARAVQLFGASFFGNGMNPAGVVINKKPLKPGGLEEAEGRVRTALPRPQQRKPHRVPR